MAVRFGMNVIYTRDLGRSVDFYRIVGLDVPDPVADRPIAVYRDDHYAMIITTAALAERFDPAWSFPERGYSQVTEFFVDDDAAVDDVWRRTTSAGFVGRTAPGHLIGPYAAVIEDPDGNVVLVTHDSEAPSGPTPA